MIYIDWQALVFSIRVAIIVDILLQGFCGIFWLFMVLRGKKK